MNSISKYTIAIILVLSNYLVSGQDMLGVMSSNYSGLYAISINPASMGNSRLYMDFNLIGFQGYLDNNYAYVQQSEILGYISNKEIPQYFTSENESRNFEIYRNGENKSGFQNIKLFGPGAMVVKGRHAFALSTGFRSISTFQDLPPDVAVFLYEAIDYEQQHNITYEHDDKIRLGSLTWVETAFSYSYNFHRYKWNSWNAGISIKPLFGMAAFYSTISDLSYQVHNDDSASVYNATFEYGFSLPVDYSTNEFIPGLKPRGIGISIDAGVTYQFTEKGHSNLVFDRICEQPYEEYNYRIGVSILDLGYIKFKNNAVYESYNNVSTEWYKPDDTLASTSINGVIGKVNSFFEKADSDVQKEESFAIYLPPAISVQADIKLRKFVYLNVTGIYGLKVGKSFLYRPSIIAFTPRYETPRFEISVPISLNEWDITQPRVGFSFRYGNFFFGFDRLNTVLGLSNFSGMDFYAGLRLNLSNAFKMNFIKGNCGMKQMRNIETFDYRNF